MIHMYVLHTVNRVRIKLQYSRPHSWQNEALLSFLFLFWCVLGRKLGVGSQHWPVRIQDPSIYLFWNWGPVDHGRFTSEIQRWGSCLRGIADKKRSLAEESNTP